MATCKVLKHCVYENSILPLNVIPRIPYGCSGVVGGYLMKRFRFTSIQIAYDRYQRWNTGNTIFLIVKSGLGIRIFHVRDIRTEEINIKFKCDTFFYE